MPSSLSSAVLSASEISVTLILQEITVFLQSNLVRFAAAESGLQGNEVVFAHRTSFSAESNHLCRFASHAAIFPFELSNGSLVPHYSNIPRT